MSVFKKILIANRGEIAVRIIKSAQRLGISCVAVYSEADRIAPHVILADEAVYIGPSPSAESYLLGDKIIEVARSTGAEAIHPGYGFLSENADFARSIEKAGLILIGPSAYAMEIMGSKLAAKAAVKKVNIPMVPGTDEAVDDVEKAIEIANEITYPILIKASAGGGGKGMRVVESADELASQMERAISEAVSSFGDGRVFIEKYVEAPRHVEIQVLFDGHGNGVYLFERECSIQRRHQKVMEEAPSANMTKELRTAMGEAAIRVGQCCNYIGAGTVEFLVDKDHNFYFLEMNTRLQVEHPVTELISGIDLVEWQIKIAAGAEIPFKQADLKITGHAIELRIYAEDPFQNFTPVTGILEQFSLPEMEGIRLDSGYREGQEIPIYYDPMLAKLIAYGANRTEAIHRLKLAINAFKIKGITSTLGFGSFVLNHPAFVQGKYNNNFVKVHFNNITQAPMEIEGALVGSIAYRIFNDRRAVVHQRKY